MFPTTPPHPTLRTARALWLAPGGPGAPEEPGDADLGDGDALDRSQVTLLVVDDTPSGRYALARGLRRLGFRVIEAANGEQALRMAPGCSAVLLDVQLPDMPGTEVCRRLRATAVTAMLPVLHVSSALPSEHDSPPEAFDYADGYLLSPVDVVFAAGIIEDLLRARRR